MKLLIKNVWNYFKKYKLYSSVVLGGIVLDLAVESFIALSLKLLLDYAVVPKNERILLIVVLLLVVSTVITKAGYIFRWYLYSKMAAGFIRDVRNELFSSLQRRSLNYFSNARMGDILAHFSSDVASVEGLMNMAVPVGMAAFLGILINMVIIFVLEWKLAILAIIGLLLCTFGPSIFNSRVTSANGLLKKQQAELLSVVEENISAQKVIKSFNLHNTVLQNFHRKTEELSGMSAKTSLLNEIMEFIPKSIIEIINVLIIGIGAFLAFQDYITAGTLVAFNGLFIGLSAAVGSFTWVFPILMESSVSMQRIKDFTDGSTGICDCSEAKDIPEMMEGIEFSDVTFGYTVQQNCLENLDLRIPKGASVALIGHSGSGKSSILNLIMRFYDPNKGSVKIDGQDIKGITQESLHRLAGVVLQDNFLFNTTIKENLILVNPQASENEIIDACKAAEIHDFIMSLPEGYDTVVGERGGQLSGGQRQRIALARALVCNPAILIMDEATSALDPKTEKAINETLKRITKGMTIINSTHRLESIKGYDVIYLLEKGHIVESGSHEELIEKNGKYAELFSKQGGFIVADNLKYAEIEVDRLAKIDLFKQIDNTVLEELVDLFVSEYYSEGQIVINAGDYGDRFYVIARGRVEVYVILEDGSERIINVLEDGDYFGEIALYKDIRRTANARACTPSMILSLKRKHFERIIAKTPEIKEKIEHEIAVRLVQLSRKGQEG